MDHIHSEEEIRERRIYDLFTRIDAAGTGRILVSQVAALHGGDTEGFIADINSEADGGISPQAWSDFFQSLLRVAPEQVNVLLDYLGKNLEWATQVRYGARLQLPPERSPERTGLTQQERQVHPEQRA